MRDVVMGSVYDCEQPLILVDLGCLQEDLEQVNCIDFENHSDNTVLLNGVLHLIENKHFVNNKIKELEQKSILTSANDYKEFNIKIVKQKLSRVKSNVEIIKKISYDLINSFNDYKLFNNSGVLLVDSLDATILNSTLVRKGKSKCYSHYLPHKTLSTTQFSTISQTPYNYLEHLMSLS